MTTPEVQLPDCTVCGGPGAVMSVMSLSDWSQQKVCPLCAPAYLRATADIIEQMLADNGIVVPGARNVPAADLEAAAAPCACGHPRHVHEHVDGEYLECGDCAAKECEQYAPAAPAAEAARQ